MQGKYTKSNVKEREIVSYAGKGHKRDEHGYAQNAEISDDVGDCPNLFEIDLTEFFAIFILQIRVRKRAYARNCYHYNKQILLCKQ